MKLTLKQKKILKNMNKREFTRFKKENDIPRDSSLQDILTGVIIFNLMTADFDNYDSSDNSFGGFGGGESGGGGASDSWGDSSSDSGSDSGGGDSGGGGE